MKVGIVTVTYNSINVLEDFLSSIEGQDFKDLTLYVVDSGSSDETIPYLASHMPTGGKLIENGCNVGFAAGTNQGIRAALQDGCGAVLVLNNDVVFGPTLVGELIQALRDYQCDMTTPMMYFHHPHNLIWAAGGSFDQWRGYVNSHRGEGEVDEGQYSSPTRVMFAPLCCVMIRSEVFARAGLLDERFFTYAEDADFMYRCMKLNISLWFVPDSKLWHKVSSLTGALSDFMIRYCIRGRIFFLYKHLNAFVAWFWTCVHFVDFAFQFLSMKNSRRITALKFRAAWEGYLVYRRSVSSGKSEAKLADSRLPL